MIDINNKNNNNLAINSLFNPILIQNIVIHKLTITLEIENK